MSSLDVGQQAAAEDRAWFVRRPDRRFRLRLITAEEQTELRAGSASHVLAERVTTGRRMRHAVRVEQPDPPEDDASLSQLLRAMRRLRP